MPPKMQTRCCSVYLCNNTEATAPKSVSWHKLPLDPTKRTAWVNNIKLDTEGKPFDEEEPRINKLICSAHFNRYDFSKRLGSQGIRGKLKKTANPTIFAWTSQGDEDSDDVQEELEDRNEGQSSPTEEWGNTDMDITNESNCTDSMDDDDDDVDDDVDQKLFVIKCLKREKLELLKKNVNINGEFSSVKKDNNRLRNENRKLKYDIEMLKKEIEHTKNTNTAKINELDARLLSYDKIKQDNNLVSFYTGFKDDLSFTAFYVYIEEKAKGLKYLHTNCKNKQVRSLSTPIRLKPGESFSITNVDMFFMVLIRLKAGFPTMEIARMFGIRTAIVKRIFTTWIEFLYVELKALFPIPPISKIVRSENRSLMILTIDCLDVRVQKASMVKTQQNHLFTYKHYKTMKFLLATTSSGSVCFVSPLIDGSLSDTKVFHDSGLLKDLSAGYAVLADDRFQITGLLPNGVSSIMVSKMVNNKADEQTNATTDTTKKSAVDKVPMEITLRRLKMYHILDTPIPFPLGVYADQIVAVCAYLTNLKPDFMKRMNPLHLKGGVATSI